MNIKGVIGCDEDQDFVVFEMDNELFATVDKYGRIDFTPTWIQHAKWVPFDSRGIVPDELLKQARSVLVGHKINEQDKRRITQAKNIQKHGRYKELLEMQEGHRKACQERGNALMI